MPDPAALGASIIERGLAAIDALMEAPAPELDFERLRAVGMAIAGVSEGLDELRDWNRTVARDKAFAGAIREALANPQQSPATVRARLVCIADDLANNLDAPPAWEIYSTPDRPAPTRLSYE